MTTLTKEDAAAFLEKLADVLESCPEARLFYTTSDDGVHLEFGREVGRPLKDVDINLGFGGTDSVQQLRDYAHWLYTGAFKK